MRFKFPINPITVEIRSFSTHPTTTIFALTTHLALKQALKLGKEPLPSLEGCGLKFKCLISFGNADLAPSAPPLSRGMWAAQVHSMEEREDGEEWWRDIHAVGSPSSAFQR